jgi:hypothetical protein
MAALSVQYGCGFSPADGWLNFDSSPTLRFERLPMIGALYTKNATRFPPSVRYGDIVKGLPVADGSVQRLYASHVLEHLAYEDAIIAIRNSFKALAPGGVFRLIVPDLAARARRYIQRADRGDTDAAEEFMESTVLGRRRRPKGPLGGVSALFGGAQHLWMWDEASMAQALTRAGFTDVRRCRSGDSGDAMFDVVEDQGRFVDGDIVEIAMACRRPA